ncbi:MAG: DUF6101 family protein [Pseudorhodoplanes sp.]
MPQESVNHANRGDARNARLTSLFKRIPTSAWQSPANNGRKSPGEQLRRQMEVGGAQPAGAGRAVRLDPFALPVRFPANDAGADGQMRQVELDRDRVVLRREVRGMRMKIRLPVEAFIGITLVSSDASGLTASIHLDHGDPALSVPLLEETELEDAASIWRAWGRVLRLPLWRRDPDGETALVQAGRRSLAAGPDTGRRRRRATIKKRRPSILMRRKPGRHIALCSLHRDEREIIARN